jgi:hypothetical protein
MIALFGLAFFKIKKITVACSLAVMALLRKHYKKKNDTQTISKEQGKQSGEKREREKQKPGLLQRIIASPFHRLLR